MERAVSSGRPVRADPAKSAAWNRGAYLVEGLGHCGACHSPRNALGAEKANAYLAGGFAEGWEAPPLTSLSHAPIPWSEDELFAYLRTGKSRFHGVAAGPMAPVVKELASLPDQDIRAMAVYLGSFNEKPLDKPGQDALAAKLESATGTRVVAASPPARGFIEGACAVCHQVGGPPLFGSRPSLALNSNLHSARAGQSDPGDPARHRLAGRRAISATCRPSRTALTTTSSPNSSTYLRQQFAPDKPPWRDVRAAVSRVRAGRN